jgi:hypothetical protein
MSKSVLGVLTFLLIGMIPIFLYAQNESAGEELHDIHCISCHTSEIYVRKNRIVNNMSELEGRIRQCELVNELAWFEEDIDAVITYLNTNFYHFNTNKD